MTLEPKDEGETEDNEELEKEVPEHVLDSVEEAAEGDFASKEDLKDALGS